MKIVLGLLGAALLLEVTGCEVGGGYGGVYGGISGEYPSSYYGSAAYPGYATPYLYGYPGYVYPYAYRGPYDRDHYWDRRRHWEQHRGHADHDWYRH